MNAPQCGPRQAGQIMSAAALLTNRSQPRTSISIPPWRATSAAAGPIREFGAAIKRAAMRMPKLDPAEGAK